ncbi:MAG: hypothetical protein Q8J98_03045 [Phaeovulum sp.]|uniref:hypothetical protein n=1 Tax=Phaeovulum sp. TaxID=2934796 RepID=UPI00273144FF|nr:hypothetical protein [Phaeovulum sp.]MDP2062064.1 hypothetical protein [Phaeovulum sp.]
MKIVPRLLAVALAAFVPSMHAAAAYAETNGCPPGLAKKNPPCVPPGQVGKGVPADQWLYRDRTGDVVGRDALIFLDDYWRYSLPRLPYGQRYAVVDDRIVVIDPESYRILQLIRVFQALTD